MCRHIGTDHSACVQSHPGGRTKGCASPTQEEGNLVSEDFAHTEKDAIEEWQSQVDETRTKYAYPGPESISTEGRCVSILLTVCGIIGLSRTLRRHLL